MGLLVLEYIQLFISHWFRHPVPHALRYFEASFPEHGARGYRCLDDFGAEPFVEPLTEPFLDVVAMVGVWAGLHIAPLLFAA